MRHLALRLLQDDIVALAKQSAETNGKGDAILHKMAELVDQQTATANEANAARVAAERANAQVESLDRQLNGKLDLLLTTTDAFGEETQKSIEALNEAVKELPAETAKQVLPPLHRRLLGWVLSGGAQVASTVVSSAVNNVVPIVAIAYMLQWYNWNSPGILKDPATSATLASGQSLWKWY